MSYAYNRYSAWIDYDTHIWPYKEYRMRYGEKDKTPHLFREAVKQADIDYENLSTVRVNDK